MLIFVKIVILLIITKNIGQNKNYLDNIKIFLRDYLMLKNDFPIV